MRPSPKVVGYRQGMFGPTQGGDTSGYGLLRRPILVAGATERPYGGYFDEIADYLESGLVGGHCLLRRGRRPQSSSTAAR